MPLLQNLDVEFVSLVDRAAVRDPSNPTEPQKFLLWKSEKGGATDDEPQGGSMSTENDSAALAKAETERDDALAKAEELQAKLDELAKADEVVEPVSEEIDKAELPPAVVARLEKLEKAEAEAADRIEKAEMLAKAERDTRITREFVAKAETMGHVAGDAVEFGKVLKAAHESLSKEEYEALEQRLNAANEQIAKGDLFKQYGSGDTTAPDGERELAVKAEELHKSEPGLSRYEAMRQAANSEAGKRYYQSVR